MVGPTTKPSPGRHRVGQEVRLGLIPLLPLEQPEGSHFVLNSVTHSVRRSNYLCCKLSRSLGGNVPANTLGHFLELHSNDTINEDGLVSGGVGPVPVSGAVPQHHHTLATLPVLLGHTLYHVQVPILGANGKVPGKKLGGLLEDIEEHTRDTRADNRRNPQHLTAGGHLIAIPGIELPAL